MHAKTESEVTITSLAASSPDHTRRPAYFVQSPSHDGEKTASFRSTPPALSPMASPPHSTKKIPRDWQVIEEEGLLYEQHSKNNIPRRCYVLAFIFGFFVLFSLFSLILLAAAKPQKPNITMKSIKFETLGIQAGSDATGVSTDMITTNSTVKFNFRNTASFFRVHVTSTPLHLSYSQLTIGSGSMEKFYQKRKSQRTVTVSVLGDKIPLYGSGSGLSTPKGVTSNPVNVTLSFRLRSRGYALGRLVKPKFYKQIDCVISFDLMKLNASIPLKNACTYD